MDWTLSVLARSRPQPATPPHRRFGCFTLVPPDAGGVVRLHFANHEDRLHMSPLAPSRLGARRGELAALFRHVGVFHPEARLVRGASWLYNIAAYRSLFPGRYIASGRLVEPAGLSGSSSWGQFLDHRGALKDEAAADFRATFERLDPDAPWRLFPLRPLRNEARVQVFHDFYGGAA